MRQRLGLIFMLVILVLIIWRPVFAQDAGQPGMDWGTIAALGGLAVAVLGLLLTGYLKKIGRIGESKADVVLRKRRSRKSEKDYKEILKRALGQIGVVGPGFEGVPTRIEETFTSLRISTYRHMEQGEPGQFPGECDNEITAHPAKEAGLHRAGEITLSPQKVMETAFQKFRLLLIIGDPGSGKTTLLKFYTVTCLDKNHRSLGFKQKQILPLFFPLRELVFEGDMPVSLYANLEAWARKRHVDIPAGVFQFWLENRSTLVLLDGLDEIGDTEKRRKVCQWVETLWTGLGRARFVLSSRPTGYRPMDNIEVECPHLRGDIMDFTPEQQAHFLNQWFRAVYLDELPVHADKSEEELKVKEAQDRAQKIIAFLQKEENKSVRQLAKVPMLLQIMAIIWKNRDFLPDTRWELYDVSLNYLLEYRDRRRDLVPVLPADKARVVLAPTALWLQEKEGNDHAPKTKIHAFMQEKLDTFDKQPDAQLFCENLRDRAGVIGDYGVDDYIFRHKSFMEFLAAIQLGKEVLKNPNRVKDLVRYFPDPWWQETLRFFIAKADDETFDRWMRRFFEAEISQELDPNQQDLLQLLVREAQQKKIKSLKQYLGSEEVNQNQDRYIIDCLKTIGTPEAVEALEIFIENSKQEEPNLALARDVVAELSGEYVVEVLANTFRNPFEDNVEYILIPGGSYQFSVTEKTEKVPDIYFCKYPVTNKRYRKFISYLEGKQKSLEENLPLKVFTEKLLEFAKNVKGYADYLGTEPGGWWKKFRSDSDENKRFNGDDQPVVAVTWYAARAYCFWLSCLQGQEKMYRLPTEVEWEWAAAGREPDGSLRKYPWAKEKGEPNPNLANYERKVDSTTPVGRYPEGATPEGLMDMAGNVWEWMENLYDVKKEYRSLRGGSWSDPSGYLRCASRLLLSPDGGWFYLGFRVVSLCSPSHTC